jgi:hypothetical protein
MRSAGRTAAALLILIPAGITACGGSSAGPPQAPPAQLEQIIDQNRVPSIVLTQVGVQRIGIQTASVTATRAPRRGQVRVVVPYAAILYEPNGSPVVYTNPAPFVYTRVPVSVASIVGDRVYLAGGLAAGTKVVTVGAEELLGVQNGVGAQT